MMGVCLSVNGTKDAGTDKDVQRLQTVIATMDNTRSISVTERAATPGPTVVFIREVLLRTAERGMGSTLGPTVPSTKDTSGMVSTMDKERIGLPMDQFTQDLGSRAFTMAMEPVHGLMVGSTRECGLWVKLTAKAKKPTPMVASGMMENGSTTRLSGVKSFSVDYLVLL
mmetsp:Transcript_130865/g.194988  ORF Transcript_130865/g.194988 Transcript_130865/m.194988 type:complete len:169 (-) Transcript_130865:146-652(-)